MLDVVKSSADSEVELIEKQNKEIIGGIVLRVGDKQIDASIHRKLNELKKSLNEQYVSDN